MRRKDGSRVGEGKKDGKRGGKKAVLGWLEAGGDFLKQLIGVVRGLVFAFAPIKSKLQHPPPPRENPGHLTIFCARGVGNLTGKAFPGVGNLTFAWVGWGKLNRKCQVSNGFFSGAEVANTYKHAFGRDGRV